MEREFEDTPYTEIRIVNVYDIYTDDDIYTDEKCKAHKWQFKHDPNVNSEHLKEMTKFCNIQQYPDCEYEFTVEFNENKYFFLATGDSAIILVCRLCIMLDNQSLNIILKSFHSDLAKRLIEKKDERMRG